MSRVLSLYNNENERLWGGGREGKERGEEEEGREEEGRGGEGGGGREGEEGEEVREEVLINWSDGRGWLGPRPHIPTYSVAFLPRIRTLDSV